MLLPLSVSSSCSVEFNSSQPHGLKPTSSSVHGILQARLLEWVAMPSFRRSSQPRLNPCLLCFLHWTLPLYHLRSLYFYLSFIQSTNIYGGPKDNFFFMKCMKCVKALKQEMK